jgi:heat shock protein HslJ
MHTSRAVSALGETAAGRKEGAMRPLERVPLSGTYWIVFAVLGLGIGITALPDGAGAQAATPAPGGALPPIVWELVEIQQDAGEPTAVVDPTRYTVQFLPDGLLAIRADCNSGSADYRLEGSRIELGPVATTLALCPPESLSDAFLQTLDDVTSYAIEVSGASDALKLSADGGHLRFQPGLTDVVWQWSEFVGGDGAVVAPEDASRYTLEFMRDGSVVAQVDCNRGRGVFAADSASISIELATTRMACPEGSLDTEFLRYVTESNTFVVRDGNLSLALPVDSGVATFMPHVPQEGPATPVVEG